MFWILNENNDDRILMFSCCGVVLTQCDGICLPKKPLHVMNNAFLGVAEHLDASGK